MKLRDKPSLPESYFIRLKMKEETIISPAEYRALLQAARSKGKMKQFYEWQRNRKITLKG